MWPSTTSSGSCECSREVASSRRLSLTRPPPVGSELVMCSIRVRRFIPAGIRTENDFVRIVDAECDGIAVLKLAAFHLFAIDEKTASLSAILDVEVARFDDDCGAVARDAAVGKLQMVAGLGAPADHEGSLRDAGIAARAVWGDDFKHGFADQRNGIRHGAVPRPAL